MGFDIVRDGPFARRVGKSKASENVFRRRKRKSDGTLVCWIGINLDIDERKRAEQELRDIVDTIPAIVWVGEPDGSNSYVNRRYVEYSGMTPAQTAGWGFRVAAHPDDLQKHEGKWRAAVASGEPHESVVRFRRADGQFRWHLDRGMPLRDEDGSIGIADTYAKRAPPELPMAMSGQLMSRLT